MSRTKSRFKEEYERENFTVRVDITNLYKLKLEAESLQKLAERVPNPRLKASADAITLLCAVMSGEMVVGDLKGESIKAPVGLKRSSEW